MATNAPKVIDHFRQEIPWVEKYRPHSLKNVEGLQDVKDNLTNFIDSFMKYKTMMKDLKKQISSSRDERLKKKLELKFKSIKSKMGKNKARLMIGPPGVGKTTIVYALANDYNLSVIELNASDTRTKAALQEKLQETVKSTNLLAFTKQKNKGKIILIDEVDGLHGQQDKGGVSALKEIISYSRYPIIMACNFKDNRKFKALYELAKPLIEVKRAGIAEIASILSKIAAKEKIEIKSEQIKIIAKRSHGDYRSAINDLQALSQGTKKITEDSINQINMNRDSEEDIYNALFNLFNTNSIQDAKSTLDKISSRDADFRMIHRYIHENVFNFFNKSEDIYNAYDNLAFADRILGYLLRLQDYAHLSYFYDILAGGLRFSKTDKVISKSNLRFPMWFRTSAAPDDEYSQKLQDIYSESLDKIMKQIKPNMKLFLKLEPDVQEFLIKIFKINEGSEKKDVKKLKSALK